MLNANDQLQSEIKHESQSITNFYYECLILSNTSRIVKEYGLAREEVEPILRKDFPKQALQMELNEELIRACCQKRLDKSIR